MRYTILWRSWKPRKAGLRYFARLHPDDSEPEGAWVVFERDRGSDHATMTAIYPNDQGHEAYIHATKGTDKRRAGNAAA